MAAPSPSMEPPQPPPSRKVHVVYYLSRAGQLEHPHLLEVAISPTEGLYLRDVKKRLAMIRGKRLPSTFAWSYKRSYKNGYVWQDLCDDDLIFPAHGCEYVLKGSEIITEACEDKCRHTSALCTRDENQKELSKTRCQESSTETNVSLKQCTILDKSAVGADAENVALGASVSNSRSHIIFEFGRSKSDTPINPVLSPVQSSTGRFYVEAETSGEEDVRSLRNHTATKPCSHVSMVENGTDAATQTEEEKALRLGSKSGSVEASKDSASQNPTELNKIDMSSPPSSSSTTSPLAYTSASKVENPSGSEKNGGSTGCWKRAAEEQDDSDPGTPSNQTSTRKSAGSQDPRGEEASARPKAKHSGASSLLQFVSCGGLDIKQQILPMSLYLKSKGSQHPSTEHFCDVLYAGQSRSWNRMGKNSSKLKNELNKNETAMNTSSAISPISERLVNSQTGTALGMGTKDSCITPRSLPSEAVLPDVISIGRSSVSDRSTNVSRELDYQTDSHWKRKHSGEIFKSSPRLGREILDYQTDSPRSKASGEIKGSPLFVARECSSRLGPLSNGGLQKDAGEKPASKAGSGALSDREVRDTVNAVKRGLAMGEKGGYESMAQLWEELLAPKGDFKDGDQRRQALSCNVWERTLQNAVDLSLPPLEFLVLHECPHCSRKFKPELLKAHMKSCNTLKCSKSGAPGRSLKSDANICQRLLRASPPATK